MAIFDIPTIDVSSLMLREEDEDGRRKAMEQIEEACVNCGFFQIENHGIPLELLSRAMDLYKTFFACSDEDKLLVSPKPGGTVPPAGYLKSPQHSDEKNEHLLILNASSGVNKNPPQFKQVLEEVISHFTKLGMLLESMISECLGLPHNTLAKFNDDRSWDFLIGLHYFPATEAEDNGKSAHEDGNCITFVYQDEVGGLQVQKDGQWIPIAPSKDKLVANIGDVIQVLSNNKFKSATHRVVRPKGKSRYSCAFFYNLQGDKWVEPLPQFTKEIGESAKYKGFFYKEYVQLRARKWTHPPSRPEDLIHITHYSISN
ncbi:1-aminocyclopropane-1-carboxylate oxidase-like isoform X1 [Nicotiana sylvestris]|uniref:1-aminocyclopropane-1-carboxylate oxidase-like isoform X1 n=2 Tax=Nicotiana sylvestris TaxID=4096 RepID=A0A1U7XJ33_NICSY|nr:PREDICTED: 1-aminocyclopropane-1-carboxylate oxidase-like isoform X1 [Nicotiana sylvestris]XP_009786480.1 PREDICTED: 1-aminocyclopropane-1-carboxylate oxidase-like isoform X1 [Nicotiana sylvestris]